MLANVRVPVSTSTVVFPTYVSLISTAAAGQWYLGLGIILCITWGT